MRPSISLVFLLPINRKLRIPFLLAAIVFAGCVTGVAGASEPPRLAQEGTRKFAQTITHIELKWGDDLRVDPITADLAMVAASWHETMVDLAGHRVDQMGYFTGLAEYREGRWQFRNAHWSSPVPTCH
jgi:hypothetical protein